MQYSPTIGDVYTKDVEVNGAPRHITIDDTAGQVSDGFGVASSPLVDAAMARLRCTVPAAAIRAQKHDYRAVLVCAGGVCGLEA